MKAVLVNEFGPIGNARYTEVAAPLPGNDDLLIEVRASEANYPDLLVMEGKYQIKPPLPFSPGKAAAGIVTAAGANVEGFAIGSRVAAQVEYGAYAEQLIVPHRSAFRLPEAMPFDVAAALGLVYQTSYFALVHRASFKPGDSVLVLGASGGVGSAAVQLAKAMGASVVIGGVLGAENMQVATALGCDHVVDLAAADLRDGLREAVYGVTSGKGCDVVIDPVGGEANAAALRGLAWCGRMVIIGFASGNIPTIKTNYLLVKNIAVAGLQWSDYRERDPEGVRVAQQKIFQLWEEGKLKPHISKKLPLARFEEALEDLRHSRVQGKVILEP
ncbi:NADPH:quinone oxidoreductase family protein [Rhizorhabdus dicambivorans]|uniref:NADPH:quinone oxidoreductase n=1 Tax=Rhizorhabdus dicambivorans TaxID=1850238 RepID=A0A2A4FSV5_9SPHN|nr:NADPH:quinone oxidoreductase family protein [Rhizorhabdus dicambivorans]ATE64386.1 NADPH:quinone oxidoreductase [Rhizorhabdus dicambivorans]PCE41267.1 NADPH:quinone oxidoreductase [Rhizorhabdus dicambivorans]